jgi:hypothetical protein
VVGGAKPTVERNIFAGNPVAIAWDGADGDGAAGPRIGVNLFWRNTVIYRVKEKAVELAKGNVVEADPGFVDAAKGDFAVGAGAEKFGAAEPPEAGSPFAIQPQEAGIIPAGKTRDQRAWQRGK